jgi:DNA-binding SARP family transcriptional activator
MRVRVLGPVEVRDDDDGVIMIRQRKVRELLFVLALATGPMPSERLQSMLWVAADTHNMLSALTTTVNRLRKLLPQDRLVRDEDGYRLIMDPGRDHLDVREFRDLVAAARKVRESDPRRAAELFQRAVEAWRDPQLPDLPDTLTAGGWADQLRAERRDAIEALVEVRMALGRHATVATELPALLASDPLNDRLWLSLLLALYRDGRKGDALRIFEDAREMYLTETGAEPSVPLLSMRDRIAANDPGLEWHPRQTAQESRAINAGSDITVASSARVYDWLLGGEANFEVDRQVAGLLLGAIPDLRESTRRNRVFLRRVVRFLVDRGIRQFLDLGTGLPTQGSVHEVAQKADPTARVVYVDNDPLVVAHGTAFIEDSRNTGFIAGDLRAPAEIFTAPQMRRLIDLTEPVGVLMLNLVHFVPADDAHLALDHYREWMPPGSALAMTHVTREGTSAEALRVIDEATQRSSVDRLFLRSPAEIETMFAGLELMAPLVDPGNWQADEALPPCSLAALGGLAFKV